MSLRLAFAGTLKWLCEQELLGYGIGVSSRSICTADIVAFQAPDQHSSRYRRSEASSSKVELAALNCGFHFLAAQWHDHHHVPDRDGLEISEAPHQRVDELMGREGLDRYSRA